MITSIEEARSHSLTHTHEKFVCVLPDGHVYIHKSAEEQQKFLSLNDTAFVVKGVVSQPKKSTKK